MLEQREQPLRRGPPAGKIARRLSAAVDEALEFVVWSHVVIPSLPVLSLLSIWPCRLFSIGLAVATPPTPVLRLRRATVRCAVEGAGRA